MTQVFDGDTIAVDDCIVRLALVNAPEYGEPGYKEAKAFIENLCGVGSVVIVDQDNGQPYDIYGRILAVIYSKNKCVNADSFTMVLPRS